MTSPERYVVVGAGAWGTALAQHLAARGPVTLWCRRADFARQLRAERRTPYLPGVALADAIRIESDLPSALSGSQAAILALPTQSLRAHLTLHHGAAWPKGPLIVANKGIELQTLALPLAILGDVLGPAAAARSAVLSGPSFASELAAGQPTAVVIAAHDGQVAAAAQQTLSFGSLRAYSSDDPLGVELGGALKNVVAIAAGVAAGLGFRHNATAALITRGLAELARLGAAMGARRETLRGLAGLGDLVLTCTGGPSRNRRVGEALASGRTIQELRAAATQVAEGIDTCRAAKLLAQRHGVELPIVDQVHAILFDGKAPRIALADLLARPLRPETEETAT